MLTTISILNSGSYSQVTPTLYLSVEQIDTFIPLAVNSDISTIQGGGRIMSGFGSVPLSCLQP